MNYSTREFVGKFSSILFFTAVGVVMVLCAITHVSVALPIRIVAAFVGLTVPIQVTVHLRSKRITQKNRLITLSIDMAIMAIVTTYVTNDGNMFIYIVSLLSLVFAFWDDYKIFITNAITSISALIVGAILAMAGLVHAVFGWHHMMAFFVIMSEQLILAYLTFMTASNKRHDLDNERSMDDLMKVVEAKCQDAREATRSKSNFLSNMSHEIRTPINSILGMNELILRESTERAVLEYASNVENSGRMLLALVNEILDFSKIESGRMELVKVEYKIMDVINDLVTMMEPRIVKKGLTFKLEVDENMPSVIRGDDVRIRQIITNLLTNAVKYTDAGSVTMRVTGRSVASTMLLHVEVEDTGQGISEDNLPKLYEAFRRINEEANRNIEGTGLGMSITNQLLEMMGSRLGVSSREGVGSNFFFTVKQDIVDAVPIGKFTRESLKVTTKDHSQTIVYAPKAKVLFVDDNDMNRTVFAQLLKRTGIQVTTADSGFKCLELIQNETFDLIYMDHMMPEMDGIQTLHKLRAIEGYTKIIPVIVLTANAITGVREMYLSEGFSDFLSKPIVPDRLEESLREFLPENLLEEPPEGLKPRAIDEAKQTASATASAEEEPLPSIDGLDWNLAEIHFPDREMMLEMVKEFRAMIMKDGDSLDRFYQNLDDDESVKEYRILVHSMKSSAALVGIIPLAGCAKILENAAAAEDRATIRAVHDVFIVQWKSYFEKLEPLCPKGETVDYDRDEFIAHLDKLLEASEMLDVDNMDPEIAAIEAMDISWDDAGDIALLSGAVVSLDTEAIAEIVARLKEKC